MAAWHTSLRRAVLAIQDRAETPTGTLLRFGTVKTVTPGAAADGSAAVVVTVRGTDTAAPYLAAYTPVVGHQVAVLLIDHSPLILGRVVGLPSF